MIAARLLPVCMLLAACTGSSAAPPAMPDAGHALAALDAPAVDTPAAPADPLRCDAPEDCAWIEDYQREVVGRLSGERPIAEGVTLTRRSTPAQRETARQYLLAELRAAGLDADLHAYATGQNVRARLPATTGAAASRIVVGAHYDGVPAGPAAADDGTGVALVLVAARYLSRQARRDHPSFLSRGFAATGVGEEFVGDDHTPHYHRATDTWERVDFDYLARTTRLALAVLADRVVD